MEFRDLKRQYNSNKEVIDTAMARVLSNTNFISGYQVTELEKNLSNYVGIKHCITCADGTDALQLALMTWGIGKGDAVFVPDFTFFATAEVVSAVGATPIFVDIDNDFNISPEDLKRKIDWTKKNFNLNMKVVIAVDLFGQPAKFEEIRRITNDNGLLLLEDGAQGFGGKIGDKRACSFGDIATTSFFPAKPLGCYGDGGAIFTDNDEWAALLKSYRVHGKGGDKYDNIRIGMNSRLDTLQAAVLIEKLKIFDSFELNKVNQVAEKYNELLSDIKEIQLPIINPNFYSSWAQYSILLPNSNIRDNVQETLKKQDIPSMIYYRKPMHEQGAYADLKDYYKCNLVTLDYSSRVLSLPMHPYLTLREQTAVANEIRNIFQ